MTLNIAHNYLFFNYRFFGNMPFKTPSVILQIHNFIYIYKDKKQKIFNMKSIRI